MPRPEELFLDNLKLVERICAHTAARAGLSADDAADFTADVKYKLIENDYAILRKYEGRSTLSTYLTTVIKRLHYQALDEQRGKWRASAEAIRLGPVAVALERLITRDGLTFNEAVEMLTTGDARATKRQLEEYYVRLPPRPPRPVLVSDELTGELSIAIERDERLSAPERVETARAAAGAIDRFTESLPAEDRLMLRMRFRDAMLVPEIAERLRIDPKRIYKRLQKHFKAMRKLLEEAGVSRDDIQEMLNRGDQEVRVGILAPDPGKKPDGPTHVAGGDVNGSGESRLSK
ncbi:MAG TPA: sigma-70 family RNA polymerase sigma factor [Thermoanaerobaculia bacterium]